MKKIENLANCEVRSEITLKR